MKYVQRIMTADGVVHESIDAATKYLDKQFGDIIMPLAHELVQHADKYSKAHEFIERHLDDFAKLLAIRKDAMSRLPDDE